jgi:malate dehydrogenase (oxaloacetate-decarboxylating)
MLQRRYVRYLFHPNSFLLLTICSQGTGAVTLAAVSAALRVTQSDLVHQRIIIYGAGSAGHGIALALRDAMTSEAHEVAIPVAEANARFWLVDKYGLIKESLGDHKIRKELQEFVRRDAEWEGALTNEKGETGLLEVIKRVKPTILIGASTHAGGFTKDVVEAMTAGLDGVRPIILPLSNPSKLVEVHPKNAFEWSKGKALIATGSPFGTVKSSAGTEYMCALFDIYHIA